MSAADAGLAKGPEPSRMPSDGDTLLSFAQERLYFLDLLNPGNSAYTLTMRKRFHGPLDVTALARSLTEVVRRHEALRTTFVIRGGYSVQHIADPGPVTLPIIDVVGHDPDERERVATRMIGDEARRPFDLARGPLIRPLLLRLSAREHELFIVLHHIVADGWSLDVLASELNALYDAFANGRESPLPELPIQYADFATWQRRWLTGQILHAERRYWRDRLTPLPAPLELPIDHPRSDRPASAGASHGVVVPRALGDKLRELSRREGTTLFMTFLAAFKVLLSRYTGQEDIVVGTPVANRHHVEFEPLIGLLANTLVLRTDLTGDPSVRELLARVRETCLGAYTYPNLPFEKLVEDLRPARVRGRNPLFEISFVFQNDTASTDFTFVGVGSPFDLTLFVRDTIHRTLSVTVQYRRELFEPETITRLTAHYLTLLEAVVADADRRLSALPLLGDAEADRVLIEWNATGTAYPRAHTIHACFEDQVDAAPDAVALVADGTVLTYRELDRRANRLAHHLRALGLDPGRAVGLWMDRSLGTIIAVLGILKAGGAYAPLDLLAPDRRLASLLGVAGIDLVLTEERMRNRLSGHGVRAIAVDTDQEAIAGRPDTRPGPSAPADSLAAVMYTSGSTGEPKGVAVTHRGVLRLVKGTDYASFGPDEVFLQLAPLSFDASTFEIWGALLNGGRLAVAPPGAPSAVELGVMLRQHRVTTLWLTAGLFRQMVDHRVEDLRPLRQLIVGGDVLSPLHVARALAALPGLRLVNGYGPTEGTTFTCCHTVVSAPAPGRSVPIGRPIANTRVYVLDRHRVPVPIGVPGELWIAGDGLARGYVDRPELTADRFVELRLSATLDERLYRTGDLVRWLGDGTLEFLGRLDDQVKIRGYRVEVTEIEAALARHPQVHASVVLARSAGDGERRLVAYVVGDGPVDSRALREFVGRTLPEYMVPATYVKIDRLPLRANGKVDRAALPEPVAWVTALAAAAEPRDELERQLLRIWQETLSVVPIGTRDNFFDLGGHSLLAVHLFARLEAELGIALPLATVFEAPTIESLATFIREGTRPPSGRSMVAIKPRGSRPPLFGIPGVGGSVLSYHALARLLGPEQPFYALQSRGLDGVEKPLTTIESIAAQFLREIREVQPDGLYYLMGACMGGVVAYEIAQQLQEAGQEIGLLALLETWPPQAIPPSRRLSTLDTPGVLGFAAGRLHLYIETLARLRGHERSRYLLGRLKAMRDLWKRASLRSVRTDFYQHAVVRANLQAFRHYQPRPYPGPAMLFLAADRPATDGADGRLAWRLLTRELEVFSVSGDDSGQMLSEPHVRVVAAHLGTCIQRAYAAAPQRRRA